MSTFDSTKGKSSDRLSKDDRYELAAQAQSQHRLNYPKHLVTLGGLLVFISLVLLAIAWQIRSSAQNENKNRAYKLATINQLISDIQALEKTQDSNPNAGLLDPIADMRSKIKGYAKSAKLDSELGLPKTHSKPMLGNTKQLSYTYTVIDPSFEHIINWIELSTQNIPGLHISDLTIRPGNQDWTITVIFSRIERQE